MLTNLGPCHNFLLSTFRNRKPSLYLFTSRSPNPLSPLIVTPGRHRVFLLLRAQWDVPIQNDGEKQ